MNKYILFGKDSNDKHWYEAKVIYAETIQEAFYHLFVKNRADRREATQYFIFRPDTRLSWEVTRTVPQPPPEWRYDPS